ncbi:MAG: alpha/beta hydrolase [Myxococcota bacterium]
MPRAVTGQGVELEYEVFEPDQPNGEAVILVMGIGAQMVYWSDDFCRLFAERGYRTVRFDNRDVGLSSKLDGERALPFSRMIALALAGRPVPAPYTLLDMADDVLGLLDHLGLSSAHVLGVSMGGMIAQTFAILHPSRVTSLTSIMSHPGGRRYLPKPRALGALLQPPPTSREEAMERAERFAGVVGSKGLGVDFAEVRDRAGRAYDRCVYPPGFVRQFAAILASPKRGAALRYVRTPAAIVHGAIDPLILPKGGQATAGFLPDATLDVIGGMGHDLPPAAWPRIVEAFEGAARRGRTGRKGLRSTG